MANEAPAKNLDKALDLLIYLSRQDEPQNVAELARYLGVTRNTIYAMLASLQSHNFVEKTQDGRFLAGYGLLSLVANYHHQYPFLYAAERYALELAEQVQTPVAVFVYKSPLDCLRLYSTGGFLGSAVGGLVHACTTAPGKLLLAAQPDEVIREDLAIRPIEKYTEKTITDPEIILSQVQQYRTAEYAVEEGERFPGNGTVAVPIRNRSEQVIAALSLTLSIMPDEEKLAELISKLRLTGLKISQELGYNSALLI